MSPWSACCQTSSMPQSGRAMKALGQDLYYSYASAWELPAGVSRSFLNKKKNEKMKLRIVNPALTIWNYNYNQNVLKG